MPANAIHELFAYLCVPDTQKAIDFYAHAFGAVELYRLTEPSGRIGHAELQMGPGAVLMLSDPFPEFGIDPPPAQGFMGMQIHLHVDDADAMGRRAVAAGATMVMEPCDQFYGERSCKGARSVRPHLAARPLDREGGAGRDAAPLHGADERRRLTAPTHAVT